MTQIHMPDNERQLRRLVSRLANDPDLHREAGELISDKHGVHIDFLRYSPMQIEQKLFELDQHAANQALKETPLLTVSMFDFGMGCNHNMPCAIESDKPAIYDGNHGVFNPSWSAQSKGWRLVRIRTKFQRWLLKKFFHKT